MYQAPPPPIPTKGTPWGLIILILLVAVGAIVGLCGFGAYLGYQQFTHVPKARPGFGNPVLVQRLSDGWAKYRFPEIPLTIELPEKPEAETLEFEPGDALTTKEWIYYGFSSDLNGLEIVGHWYQGGEDVSTEEELDYIDWFVEESMDAKDLTSTSKQAKFANLEGYRTSGTFTSDGEKMKLQSLLWVRGNTAINIFGYYYPEYQKEAEAEFNRIADSIREE
jgi:hypothetical protein